MVGLDTLGVWEMNTPDHHPVALPPVIFSEADRDRLYAIAISALANNRMAPAASNVLREISRAKIVPNDELPVNVVAVNSHVDVRDNVVGTNRRVVLVLPDEASTQPNAVSVLSPLGAALIGLSEGYSIEWCTASGERSSVTVLQSTPPSSARPPTLADRQVSRLDSSLRGKRRKGE
jgi:regulator of nucleoside diphosphate kinase